MEFECSKILGALTVIFTQKMVAFSEIYVILRVSLSYLILRYDLT